MDCNACPVGHTCGSDQFEKDATPCTAEKTNSLDNEFMCYPHLSTWPQMPVYPTDPDNIATFTTNTIGTPVTEIYEITSGSFSYTGTQTSYDCPPGHQCIFPQFQNWISCPPGYWSGESMWACEPCPDKMYCPMRGDESIAVMDGYYSPFAMHVPMMARAGYEAGPSTALTPCKPGYQSDDMALQCRKCVTGEVCSFTSNRPMVCNEGFESNAEAPFAAGGRFTCVPCQPHEIYNPVTKLCE